MKIRSGHWLFLMLLAVVLTIALTYATVELPRAINSVLHKFFDFPGFDSSREAERTKTFIDSHYIRLIGYGSFALVVILIVVGLIAEKRSMSSIGAVAFFLPVFGHFALSMFFLAGLGILRVVWMPILDISYDMLRLGDISYVPYMIAVYVPFLIRIDIRTPFAYAIMGLGILTFIFSALTWFYARFRKKRVVDFWVYRFSRHPQYLGWILWSYGFMIYVTLHSTLYRIQIQDFIWHPEQSALAPFYACDNRYGPGGRNKDETRGGRRL